MKGAFQQIDDWSYGWLDKSNLKRFLRKLEYFATKTELVAILRRFDMDGDAKINYKEFEIGIKSRLTTYGGKCDKVRRQTAKKERPKSNGGGLQWSPS